MKTYVSTCCLDKKLTLEDVLSAYQKMGIKNVELTSGRGYQNNLGIILRKFDFNYCVHNYFPEPKKSFVMNLCSLNEKIRFKSIDRAIKGIDLSKKLKTPHYAIHSGFLYDPEGKVDRKTGLFKVSAVDFYDKNLAFDKYLDSVTTIYKYAEGKGVKLLIENNICVRGFEDKLILCDYDDFKVLFKKIGNLKIGVLLDSGHLKVSAKTLNFSPIKFIDKISSRISAFHIHDNNGKGDFHQKIEKDSWLVEVLRNKKFKNLPKTLEANNLTIKEIKEQLNLLESL